MNQQPSTPDLFPQRQGPDEYVLEQACADSSAFVADVDTETGQQRNWLRVAASALSQPNRRIINVDLSHAPAVIPNYFILCWLGDYKHLGRTHRHRLAGMMAKPFGLLV